MAGRLPLYRMDLEKALKEIKHAGSAEALEEARIKYLGRKGILAGLFSELPKFKGEERARRGQELNALKQDITVAVQQREQELQGDILEELVVKEKVDVTLPGTRPPQGHLHITTAVIEEITRIFSQIGFHRVRYPEVDWDHYAFETLNMPKDHPARDEWETFFIARPKFSSSSEENFDGSNRPAEHAGATEPERSGGMSVGGRGGFVPLEHPKLGKMVLTPHTSNGQVREMERRKPPIRMINIAKCYRRQSDVSHVPMFHQFEGLLVDRNISVTHLKGTWKYFVHAFFGPERKIRLRPFHFRFTEPSFEVDVSCGVCGGEGYVHNPPQPSLTLREGDRSVPPLRVRGGEGELRQKCRLCKSGWVELAGGGMVHPNVLRAGGLDPKEWSGFAFGFGVERSYMMKAGLRIPDIRVLYNNELSFLEQF